MVFPNKFAVNWLVVRKLLIKTNRDGVHESVPVRNARAAVGFCAKT